jgi:hypothetical protein
MMNASRWLLAYPVSNLNLMFCLLLADTIFPANWESLLAILSHSYSPPGLRRFVISILYLQLCLVPNSTSYES